MKNKRNILLLSGSGEVGGREIYVISLYKKLLSEGHNVSLLVAKGSGMENELVRLGINHDTFKILWFFTKAFQPLLLFKMYKLCKEKNIEIVHCNIHRETYVAKKVAKFLPVKVVLTRHITQKMKPKYLKDLDGFIGVSDQISEMVRKERFGVKNITVIPPFFESKNFKDFKSNETRRVFFYREFGISLKDIPVVCMVANMYGDPTHKNHTLLIDAVKKLINEKNKELHVLLVGSGERMDELKRMVKDLNLEEYIYFLGKTDKIPEILYHSDIKALVSINEAFGIVFLEAAMLKKPLICATKTGAAGWVVKHDETGLLFENNSVDNLVEQLEKLIDDPILAKQLGQGAYKLVSEEFLPEHSLKKLETFYEKVLGNK